MCHDSSAASSVYVAMDVSAAKSVMSSHPVAECKCSLSIQGGTSIALSPVTDIFSPSEDCGTEIEIAAEDASDSFKLRCTSNVVNGIAAGTIMSIALRRDDSKPEDGYNFDYCLVMYIREYVIGKVSLNSSSERSDTISIIINNQLSIFQRLMS